MNFWIVWLLPSSVCHWKPRIIRNNAVTNLNWACRSNTSGTGIAFWTYSPKKGAKHGLVWWWFERIVSYHRKSIFASTLFRVIFKIQSMDPTHWAKDATATLDGGRAWCYEVHSCHIFHKSPSCPGEGKNESPDRDTRLMLLQDYGKAEEERQATRIHMYLQSIPYVSRLHMYPVSDHFTWTALGTRKQGRTDLFGFGVYTSRCVGNGISAFLMHHDGCISMQMSTRHNQPKTVWLPYQNNPNIWNKLSPFSVQPWCRCRTLASCPSSASGTHALECAKLLKKKQPANPNSHSDGWNQHRSMTWSLAGQ